MPATDLGAEKEINMSKNEKTLMAEVKISGEELFCGRVLRLHKDTVSLPDGHTAEREVIRHGGAVCVIPYDGQGNIWVVEQYRYAVARTMTEIPAGKLDRPDEPPQEAARRELKEETGLTCDKLIPLGLYLGSPAILDEKIHMFAAVGLHTGNPHPDDDEFLRARPVPLEEMVQATLKGQIPDGKTQCAVLRLRAMLERGLL